jgi:predicted RNase H-like HicB family nuclease
VLGFLKITAYSCIMMRRLIMNHEFDGFTVFLAETEDEDGEYIAHFVELPNVSAFGETPEEALHELKVAWKGVKESYKKHEFDSPAHIHYHFPPLKE